MLALSLYLVVLALWFYGQWYFSKRPRQTKQPRQYHDRKRKPTEPGSGFNPEYYPQGHPLNPWLPLGVGSKKQKGINQQEIQEVIEEIDATARKLSGVVGSIDSGAVESNTEVWNLIHRSRSLLWSVSGMLTSALSAEQTRLVYGGTPRRPSETDTPDPTD